MSKLWIPESKRLDHVRGNSAGSIGTGGRKLLIHTTEGGTSAEGIVGTLRSKNAWVHFIHDPIHNQTIQCLPLDEGARGLMHRYGPETNRANVVQIEVVGFAYETTARKYGYDLKWAVENWKDEQYENLADLAIKIHRRFPFAVRVRAFQKPKRFTPVEFVRFAGICGHMHVPGNDHGDPGTNFRGGKFRNLIKEGL